MVKKLTVVPSGKNLIDIILSKTQRQTPTVVHKGSSISRLRSFYMRKVRFTRQNFHNKLSLIIDEFPRLDAIHPFHSDLLHVLYNKDHYKLALGQVNTARKLIRKISKDYVRLLKYGDSLYRCKCLKISALGRMSTVAKRIGPSLAYLEQIRQHMARLPSIDPTAKTILICGYPNVGKSSFMNKVTRADVDVQPYAFTTKSLFVGHTDYKCLRYQVIDTPGILDRPLEDRNIIEMCSITALAHLSATVLFFLDVSGSCGYSIAQQADLFHSIKPLFMNKPLMVVCNKIDLQPIDGLSDQDKKLVEEMKFEAMKTAAGNSTGEDQVLVSMSTLTDEGVITVKNTACERLLDVRVETKMKSKKMNDCLNQFHVAMPKPRDEKERPACIPQSVLEAKAKETEREKDKEKRKLERDLENENGGAGVYSASLKKHYILANDEWEEDIISEIFDGHNVADFSHADILQQSEELEREEAIKKWTEEDLEMDGSELTSEEREALTEIRRRKKAIIQEHRIKKPIVPRKHRKFTTQRMGRQLSNLGIDPSIALTRLKSRKREQRSLTTKDNRLRIKSRARKRERSISNGDNNQMEMDNNNNNDGKKRSMWAVRIEGLRDEEQKKRAVRMGKRSARQRSKMGRKGEADRVIPTRRPKHFFSGKRGNWNTHSRRMDTNDSLKLAPLWHTMHAISQQLSPVLGCTGIDLLNADTFDLHCFQSLTGTKFFVICEPGAPYMELLLKAIYELYTDYVLKNPFYEMEMPIRCGLCDLNLSLAVQKDRIVLLGR